MDVFSIPFGCLDLYEGCLAGKNATVQLNRTLDSNEQNQPLPITSMILEDAVCCLYRKVTSNTIILK